MQIDDKLIAYLENLSRIRLSEDEKQTAGENLGEILNYIQKLNELDTEGVEAVSHPFPFTNSFREDQVEESFDRDLILQNAPEQKDGCFKAPKTVE